MNMMMKLLGAAFFILHSSFFISCSDMLETDSSRQVFDPALDQKTDSVYYALGILQGMQQLADQYMFQGEMRGDLVETTDYTDNNLRQLANFSATAANKYDSAYVYYRVINNCNYYIAHRDTTLRTGANYVAMREYVGVKALRAWAYMQLTRTYEKVPFYTEPLTQISDIDDGSFPELDLAGVVSRLAPDLEQYSHTDYALPPDFGNVSPASILPAYLFVPVDVVLGDMYLETGQYDKAATHYVTWLTEVASPNHTAYVQDYSASGRRVMGGMGSDLPGDWSQARNGLLAGATRWASIFTGNAGDDFVTYIPMVPSKLQGVASLIPLSYGYDYYANNAGYIDEVQIVPSQGYTQLVNNTDFYYITMASNEVQTVVSYSKLGDTRYSATVREREDDETNSTTVWVNKFTRPQVILYRRSMVLLHLAEAFNRLGMYDAAFAILKDGINKYLVAPEGGAMYISPETRQALRSTYPLLSEQNISKFDSQTATEARAYYYGVHSHGSGYTSDYTGTTYQPGLSPYQPDTIIGLKLAELAQQGIAVGTTRQDTINAMEDIICDEMALEAAFEGSRFFDLCRLARHKNQAGLYGADYGSQWLARKLAYKKPVVNLQDPKNWYLPFK